MALAALAAVLVLAPGSAEAGAPQNVITATGVDLSDSSCGEPDLRIMGDATGGQPPGDAEERGTSSTLLVDDAGSFEQTSVGGYPAGPFDYGYGVSFDIADPPEGTVIAHQRVGGRRRRRSAHLRRVVPPLPVRRDSG